MLPQARHAAGVAAIVLLSLAGGPAPRLAAQSLPLRCWGPEQGLAGPRVMDLEQDRAGFLWVATVEGLARFDGDAFRGYSTRDGIGYPLVNAVAFDARDGLWAATNGAGIAHLLEGSLAPGAPSFAAAKLGPGQGENQVNRLLITADGDTWAATDAGLYRLRPGAAPERVAERRSGEYWLTAAQSADGQLAFGGDGELLLWSGSQMFRWPLPGDAASRELVALRPQDGGLLVATRRDLFTFDPRARPSWRRLPLALAGETAIYDALRDSRGTLWLATRRGLVRADERPRVYTDALGLPTSFVRALAEDREGNLWLGTDGAGICRLSLQAQAVYAGREGLRDSNVVGLAEGEDGAIYISTQGGGLYRVDGERAVLVEGTDRPPFAAVGHKLARDPAGGWWAGTDEGLYRIRDPGLRFDRAERVSGSHGLPEDGMPDAAGALHFDRQGNLWVVTEEHGVFRRAAGSETFERQIDSQLGSDDVNQVGADGAGNLWIATYFGLWRRHDGRLEKIGQLGGRPTTGARFFFCDRENALWIGFRDSGAARLRHGEPSSATVWSVEEGLPSRTVWAITQDARGAVILGTNRGLVIVDPATGLWREMTSRSGLAGDLVNALLRDRSGTVWVGTSLGVTRLAPMAPDPPPPPPVRFLAIEVAGEGLPLPARGASRLDGLEFGPRQDNLRIEFASPSFRGEPAVAYEWRLARGGGEPRWRQATRERTLDFANLAPGRYRFEVRAAAAAAIPPSPPARLEFVIHPPLWRRAWFQALAAGLLFAAGYWLIRLRVERALQLERVRRQIATDLHDDIGAGLSQIAILSELARRQEHAEASATLGDVAGLARALRQSMADIVWAVDPRRDRLDDLLRRMRQTAYGLLEAEGVAVTFTSPPSEDLRSIELAPDRRRHVFLFFTEAIHNVARHAGARSARIAVRLERRRLAIEVADDGRGFEPSTTMEGTGLPGLRHRAAELDGKAEVRSRPQGGTTVTLEVQL